MKRISKFLLTASLLVVTAFTMSETPRVGGSGGRRTVTMDCGSGAYIVGVTASGGKDGPIGFNLLRRVKFTCRPFNGTTPGTTTSTTTEAVSDKAGTVEYAHGTGICPSSQVVIGLDLYAGFFIDRLNGATCLSSTQAQTNLYINAGGQAGTRTSLQCPSAEALYKIEARVGDAIDSLKGYCRAFGSISALGVGTQIGATASPKPTASAPLSIPVNSSKTISFTVTDFNTTSSSLLIGITGETDLLGGAIANPPEFKLQLINPAGTVVTSKSFSNTTAGVIYGVTYRIDANGGWKLKITNLKQTIGTFVVKSFWATTP